LPGTVNHIPEGTLKTNSPVKTLKQSGTGKPTPGNLKETKACSFSCWVCIGIPSGCISFIINSSGLNMHYVKFNQLMRLMIAGKDKMRD
jgi:hypothetical protein